LDSLPPGRQIALSRGQVDRLFGLDDVGTNRLLRFAVGHRCEIVHANECVVFEKRPRP
jgi:hypothetical protein